MSTYSIHTGTNIESHKLVDLDSVLNELTDNTSQLIFPLNLRDAVYTVYENIVYKPTTNGAGIEYVGISRADFIEKMLIGKRQYSGADTLTSALLNTDIDLFIYNSKLDSASIQNTKVGFLAGADSSIFTNGATPSIPYIETRLITYPSGNVLDFNIINNSYVFSHTASAGNIYLSSVYGDLFLNSTNTIVNGTSSNGSNFQVNGSASIDTLYMLGDIVDKAGHTGPAGYYLSATNGGVFWSPVVIPPGTFSGVGISNYVSLFSGSYSFTTSNIYQNNNSIIVNATASNGAILQINGSASINNYLRMLNINTASTADIIYVSATDSFYGVPGGTTSTYLSPASYGGLSWINTLYSTQNELASIKVVGDGTVGYNPATYSLNTGNIVFSIGDSQSVATEKVRMSKNSLNLYPGYTLQIGNYPTQLNYTPLENGGIRANLSIFYDTVRGAMFIYDTAAVARLKGYFNIVQLANLTTSAIVIYGPSPTSANYVNARDFTYYSYPGGASPVCNGAAFIGLNYQYGAYVKNGVDSSVLRTGGFVSVHRALYATDGSNGTFSHDSFASCPDVNISKGNVYLNIADFRAYDTKWEYPSTGSSYSTVAAMDRYSLLIDYNTNTQTFSHLGGLGTFSYNNAWGVYQSNGANNFFNGQVLVGTSASNGSNLRVSGTASIDYLQVNNLLYAPTASSNPTTTTEGAIYYNTASHSLMLYTNAGWKTINVS